jgi:hypothetical protein
MFNSIKRKQNGNVLVIVVMFLPILLILFLFLVDFGFFVTNNAQIKISTDLAISAGGAELGEQLDAWLKKNDLDYNDTNTSIGYLDALDKGNRRLDFLNENNIKTTVEKAVKDNFDKNFPGFIKTQQNFIFLYPYHPPYDENTLKIKISTCEIKSVEFKLMVTKKQEFDLVKSFLKLDGVDIKAEAEGSLQLCS